jgi:predicted HTH transcriptional regulator
MDEHTLRQLIAGGETATIEFKSSAARPIDIAVRMCGMANNRAGGIIIFGIEDASRAIVGLRNPSLTNDVVLRAARMIKPAVPLSETSVQMWRNERTDVGARWMHDRDGCDPTQQRDPLPIRWRLLRAAWHQHSAAIS